MLACLFACLFCLFVCHLLPFDLLSSPPSGTPPPPSPDPATQHVFCLFTCHLFPPVVFFSSLCLFSCVYSPVYSGDVVVLVSSILLLQVEMQATCMQYKWDCKQHACTTNGTARLFVVVVVVVFRWIFVVVLLLSLLGQVSPYPSDVCIPLPLRQVSPYPSDVYIFSLLGQVSPYPSDVYIPYLQGRSHLTLQTCIALTFRAGFTAFTTNALWVHTVRRRAARQHAGGILLPKVTLTVMTAVRRCPHVPGLHDVPIRSEAGSEVRRYAEGIRSIFGSRHSPVGCVAHHGTETDHVAHGHHLAVLDDRACRRPAVFSWWVERVLYLLS